MNNILLLGGRMNVLNHLRKIIVDAINKTVMTRLDISLSSLLPSRCDVVHDIQSQTVNASSTLSVTKSDVDSYNALIVVVRVSFDPSATSGVRVRWLYSPDGVNYDSSEEADVEGNYRDIGYDEQGNFVSAGKTRQATILVPILTPYVKIEIRNNDSTYPVTLDVWTVKLR